MKQFFLKTILFLFTIAFYNCENNDPQEQLPPITQTGANTFGAIVDGRAFTPADSFSTTLFELIEIEFGKNWLLNKLQNA
jgi:hypothetical protein